MIKMNLGSAKIRDPKTKQFNPIAGLIGESAYQTAIRLGTFSGTEKEWNDYIKTEREKALEDIRKAGEDLTKSLPADYVKMTEDVASLKEDKITKPAEVPTIGKILRVKSVNEDGTFTCEWADDGGSNLDVQIDGKSVVQDGVAEIPLCTASTAPGLIKIDMYSNAGGLYRANNATGLIRIAKAENTAIDKRENIYCPIVPANLDYAVKAAMCDGKGAAWTAEEQAAARERMGAWTTIADITLAEDVNSIDEVSAQGYRRYSVVVLLSQIITTDCYIQPRLVCGNSKTAMVYESAKNMTFLLFNIEEFGYIGGKENSSLFGCESFKSEIGTISPNTFKYSTAKVNYNSIGKFPFLTEIGIVANGASIPSGSRIIIRGYN